MEKPVCSAPDSGWGSLGYLGVGYRKDARTKESGYGCNKRI